jgi:hypothetical protein
MPYLKREWMIDTEMLEAGTWVPERSWDRWQERAKKLPPDDQGLLMWRHDPDTRSPMTSPPQAFAERQLSGGAGRRHRQRATTRLIYTNLIERLKNAPSDATADEVVEQMQRSAWRAPTGPRRSAAHRHTRAQGHSGGSWTGERRNVSTDRIATEPCSLAGREPSAK